MRPHSAPGMRPFGAWVAPTRRLGCARSAPGLRPPQRLGCAHSGPGLRPLGAWVAPARRLGGIRWPPGLLPLDAWVAPVSLCFFPKCAGVDMQQRPGKQRPGSAVSLAHGAPGKRASDAHEDIFDQGQGAPTPTNDCTRPVPRIPRARRGRPPIHVDGGQWRGRATVGASPRAHPVQLRGQESRKAQRVGGAGAVRRQLHQCRCPDARGGHKKKPHQSACCVAVVDLCQLDPSVGGARRVG